MLRFYVRDLGGLERFLPVLSGYREAYVEPELAAELRGIARVLDVSEEEVVVGNLYYDAMKVVLSSSVVGCTALR